MCLLLRTGNLTKWNSYCIFSPKEAKTEVPLNTASPFHAIRSLDNKFSPHTRKIIVLSTKSNCVLSFSIACSTIAKQFLLSAAKDQKTLTSSKLQFIDATVKSELFVHKGKILAVPLIDHALFRKCQEAQNIQ